MSDATLQVLVAVVTARWSSPRELVDGIESLARTTLLVRAERDGQLDSVEDELFRLGRIVAGTHDLERLLGQLLRYGWLSRHCLLVLERSSRQPEPVWPPGLVSIRNRSYGQTVLWYVSHTP